MRDLLNQAATQAGPIRILEVNREAWWVMGIPGLKTQQALYIRAENEFVVRGALLHFVGTVVEGDVSELVAKAYPRPLRRLRLRMIEESTWSADDSFRAWARVLMDAPLKAPQLLHAFKPELLIADEIRADTIVLDLDPSSARNLLSSSETTRQAANWFGLVAVSCAGILAGF